MATREELLEKREQDVARCERLLARKYSELWSIDENHVISHDDGAFYSVVKGQYGNPVILQKGEGNVYLSRVHGKFLCEKEIVFESGDAVTKTEKFRVCRAAVWNPEQHDVLKKNAVLLGMGHADPQRIYSLPIKLWLVELEENPNTAKYMLKTMKEIAESSDNFGMAALFMYKMQIDN
jgi:hypothetical protein